MEALVIRASDDEIPTDFIMEDCRADDEDFVGRAAGQLLGDLLRARSDLCLIAFWVMLFSTWLRVCAS